MERVALHAVERLNPRLSATLTLVDYGRVARDAGVLRIRTDVEIRLSSFRTGGVHKEMAFSPILNFVSPIAPLQKLFL